MTFEKQYEAKAFQKKLEQPAAWVGLTQDEVQTLWKEVIGWGDPSHDDEDLVRAIEAKLRQKNGGAA